MKLFELVTLSDSEVRLMYNLSNLKILYFPLQVTDLNIIKRIFKKIMINLLHILRHVMTVFDVKTIIPDQGDQLCDKINSAISSTYWSFEILITIFIFSRNERNVEKKGGRFRFLALRRPTRGPATSPRPTQPITSIGPSRRPPRINSSFGGDFENIQSFRVSRHKKKIHEKKNLIFFFTFSARFE